MYGRLNNNYAKYYCIIAQPLKCVFIISYWLVKTNIMLIKYEIHFYLQWLFARNSSHGGHLPCPVFVFKKITTVLLIAFSFYKSVYSGWADSHSQFCCPVLFDCNIVSRQSRDLISVLQGNQEFWDRETDLPWWSLNCCAVVQGAK